MHRGRHQTWTEEAKMDAAAGAERIIITCSHCGQSYRLNEQQLSQVSGKRIKCRKCQNEFVTELAVQVSSAPCMATNSPGTEEPTPPPPWHADVASPARVDYA